MPVRNRGFEFVEPKFRSEDLATLPLRCTKTSAGYDFYTTKDLCILPQEKVSFKTNVKAYMKPNEFLMITVRSSMGIKRDLMISNTIGIIDSDYYSNADNDGNIIISIRNLKPKYDVVEDSCYYLYDIDHNLVKLPKVKDLTVENAIFIEKGERIAQGIFVQFKEADNCNSADVRSGGVGHTDEVAKDKE